MATDVQRHIFMVPNPTPDLSVFSPTRNVISAVLLGLARRSWAPAIRSLVLYPPLREIGKIDHECAQTCRRRGYIWLPDRSPLISMMLLRQHDLSGLPMHRPWLGGGSIWSGSYSIAPRGDLQPEGQLESFVSRSVRWHGGLHLHTDTGHTCV